MNRIISFAAAALISATAMASFAFAQSSPNGAPGDQKDRCERLKKNIAKHPAPNAAVEARREKRLADCLAGKNPGPGEGDEAATGAEPGQGGSSAQGDQTASGGQPQAGTPPGDNGQPGAGSGDNGASAPVSMAAPTLAPVAGAVRAAPGGMGRGMSTGLTNVVPAFTSLDISVTTGDDDLRGDSLAWIAITDPDGTPQKCDLKAVGTNVGFDNNSTSNLKCSLSTPLTSDQLRAAKFALDYNGNAGATIATGEDAAMSLSHTTDNWKVNAIRIRATGAGDAQQCVLNASGAPLVEMRGDNRSFALGGGC